MSLPESQALQALWERATSDPLEGERAAAMLVEHFQDTPHAEILFRAQASTMEFAESGDEARLQVRHVLWKIEINRKIGQIKALTERLSRGQLSKDEHLEYGRMIAEVKLLEQRLQAEGRNPSS
jgi:hypothetical protein